MAHASRIWLSVFIVSSMSLAAPAASVVIDSMFVGDVDVPGPQTVIVPVDFSATSNISGIGLIADWTGVVRDNGGGLNPWSLDMRLTTSSPSGSSLVWDPIGGDVTIADYPFADYSPHYASPQPAGIYDVAISTPGVPNPWVSGLRDATIYALGEAPDVADNYNGSVATGPEWNRPFSIGGISGLGPVVYDVVEFTVPASGSYSFRSILPSGDNNFTFLYRNGFDPELPLDNLLDYGLGNGSAPNGTPRGTSLIEALLLEGETYHYVTSQFQRFIPGGDFLTFINGPALINVTTNLPGDFDGDSDYDCDDVNALTTQIAIGANPAVFDLTGDALVDGGDLTEWLRLAGAENLASGNSYLPADMTLDGFVDGTDFIRWNENRFTAQPLFCNGDLNADGFVDGLDFVIWNDFRFQSSEFSAVPEPSALVLFAFVLCSGFASTARGIASS